MFAYLLLALTGIGCGVFLRRTLVYATTARSISMWPTLADGDLLITHRIHAGTRLRRGDIVVLYVDEVQQSVVKRLAGLPGDEIDVAADGTVQVDGGSAGPSSLHLQAGLDQEAGRRSRHRVPAGHYYFLGDNRSYSNDSRFWVRPYVARSSLEGKVCFRLWPRPRSLSRTHWSKQRRGYEGESGEREVAKGKSETRRTGGADVRPRTSIPACSGGVGRATRLTPCLCLDD